MSLLQKEPIEALFRSALLVLLDNATAEYSFISTFFSAESTPLIALPSDPSGPMPSPAYTITDNRRPSVTSELHDVAEAEESTNVGYGAVGREGLTNNDVFSVQQTTTKEGLAVTATIWKQIMEPALNYCQVCCLDVN